MVCVGNETSNFPCFYNTDSLFLLWKDNSSGFRVVLLLRCSAVSCFTHLCATITIHGNDTILALSIPPAPNAKMSHEYYSARASDTTSQEITSATVRIDLKEHLSADSFGLDLLSHSASTVPSLIMEKVREMSMNEDVRCYKG